ncbi:hypothetical protein PTTW11_09888 [Pyrenophora teres f. teres]|uniref:Uncharacterized protein n=1 Tax=Pyrenophora teres f. teres TaxID=97479 RepID=A0A6S6WIH1_9PLEO|nr:hypothetical protein PTTW11_09888 [Pyrenophora teres f. teres]
MATFEEVNRPSTPYVHEEEFYKLAGQINQLLRHLNKADIDWIEDAIRSWEEPTLLISEEEKQEIYDELC